MNYLINKIKNDSFFGLMLVLIVIVGIVQGIRALQWSGMTIEEIKERKYISCIKKASPFEISGCNLLLPINKNNTYE